MHPLPFFGKSKILQKLAYITGAKCRYFQPFLPEFERGCQGGGCDNERLCKAEAVDGALFI